MSGTNQRQAILALGVASILGDISWFLLGFLFYATAYAAVASLVSRQEAAGNARGRYSMCAAYRAAEIGGGSRCRLA